MQILKFHARVILLIIILCFINTKTNYAQTTEARGMKTYCGEFSRNIYYINGIRFKVNCEAKDRVYKDSGFRYLKFVYNLNGLQVADSLLDISKFSRKQIEGKNVITCNNQLKSNQDPLNKYMVVEMNLKSKIYLNGKLLKTQDDQKILTTLNKEHIKSVNVVRPFPLFFWNYGKVKITTV